MNGEFGQTDFEWQEGAGPLVVNGSQPGVQTSGSQLDVLGDQAGETWTISPENAVALGVQIVGQNQDQHSIGQIDAYDIDTVSVDADDQANSGGETYVVNDLSTTGVTLVNLNLHEYTTAPDASGDHVTVNGPAGADTVDMAVQQVPTGQYGSNGLPTYTQQWTTTQITTTLTTTRPVGHIRSLTTLTPPCPSRATRSMSTHSPAPTR